jgi:hypothetical protein
MVAHGNSLRAYETIVTGEAKDVIIALHEAFERAAITGHVFMTVTVSNACRSSQVVLRVIAIVSQHNEN